MQRLQSWLTGRATTGLIIGLGTAYVLFAGWLMATATFDIWGALVALPIVAAIAIAVARHTFSGDLIMLQRAALIGLAVKLAGTLARYWVANDAYAGASDSNTYHATGRIIAGELWDGTITIVELMPHTLGTRFIGELTGVLYAIVGSSKLAGFLWFGLLGHVGVMLTVKAGCLAIPGLARSRYAWLCFLMPSLVFWPSSIGKEAWMSLVLGAATMGAARLFCGEGTARALPWLASGLFGAVMVRPHMAAIWLAALVLALTWSAMVGRADADRRNRTATLMLLAGTAVCGLWLIAEATVKYLDPTSDTGSSVAEIVETTGNRTSQGGSRYDPINITGPLDYPYAVARTLTRPFVWEVSTLATVLPALEIVVILGLVLRWRGNAGALARQLRRTPYVVYAMLICLLGALAFSSFGNLAILVRQRSLLMPMLLLLPCLPARELKGLTPAPEAIRPRAAAAR